MNQDIGKIMNKQQAPQKETKRLRQPTRLTKEQTAVPTIIRLTHPQAEILQYYHLRAVPTDFRRQWTLLTAFTCQRHTVRPTTFVLEITIIPPRALRPLMRVQETSEDLHGRYGASINITP